MAKHKKLKVISKNVDQTQPSGVSVVATNVSGRDFKERLIERKVHTCHYALTNITPIGYKQRIKAAEATLVIAGETRISDNVRSLASYAIKVKKPCIVVQLRGCLKDRDPVGRIVNWIKRHRFKTLNVAVSREIWQLRKASRKSKSDSIDPWEPIIFLILNVAEALSNFCNLTQVIQIDRPFTSRKSCTGRLYRHGDLLIRQIKQLPVHLKALQTSVLSQGEHTGHTHELHSIDGSMLQVFENGRGSKYLKTDRANLIHQEHAPITIEKGFYSVRQEREYDYFDDEEWDEGYGYFWERINGSISVDD